MKATLLTIDPLDLGLTLGCGQTFRWRQSQDCSWTGPIGDQLVTISTEGRRTRVVATPGVRNIGPIVKKYLRANDDINRIQATISRDPVLGKGIRELRGLRIVKMDEWECLVSYVLATYANIPRITKMIDAISRNYGREIACGVHAFPSQRELSEASEKELTRLGLGYRAAFVHELCGSICARELDHMKRMDTEHLRTELLSLPGVGNKVADCVSLFGFGRLEAFPIDVWIERALARLFGQRGTYRSLRAFAQNRFGEYAGYAQEYLYHNERSRVAGGACAFRGTAH